MSFPFHVIDQPDSVHYNMVYVNINFAIIMCSAGADPGYVKGGRGWWMGVGQGCSAAYAIQSAIVK